MPLTLCAEVVGANEADATDTNVDDVGANEADPTDTSTEDVGVNKARAYEASANALRPAPRLVLADFRAGREKGGGKASVSN